MARAIYMYSTLEIFCPFVPRDVDVSDVLAFQRWLSDDPGDYPCQPFHNGLKLFLWIVYSCYKLEESVRVFV